MVYRLTRRRVERQCRGLWRPIIVRTPRQSNWKDRQHCTGERNYKSRYVRWPVPRQRVMDGSFCRWWDEGVTFDTSYLCGSSNRLVHDILEEVKTDSPMIISPSEGKSLHILLAIFLLSRRRFLFIYQLYRMHRSLYIPIMVDTDYLRISCEIAIIINLSGAFQCRKWTKSI